MKTTSCLLLSAALLAAVSLLPAGDTPRPAAPAPSPGAGSYAAHEWGTFTSVQAADGIQMTWNPLSVADLPKFVYDGVPVVNGKRLARGYLGKALATRQRMETPVIYFYSDREQSVDVAVDFPQGTITEWFPRLGPGDRSNTNQLMADRSRIRWPQVKLHPLAAHPALGSQLPTDPSGSHYYAARETAADFLEVNGTGPDGRPVTEIEKFLFYRGVGGFTAPLTVTQSGEDAETLSLSNTGPDELRHLFVYTVRGNQAKFGFLPELAPKAGRTITGAAAGVLGPLSEVRAQVARELADALVSEGLFPDEAMAMVKTWDDSWLAEPGTRVLYVLPRAWTDRVLPLRLSPPPKDLVRVMVGRAELITPRMEWNLTKQLVRYLEGDDAGRPKVVEATRGLGLGRFLEPTARRVQARVGTEEMNAGVAGLMRDLAGASKPPGAEDKLARLFQ